MIQLRRSRERGQSDLGWLQSQHTFSFGGYQDPRHAGFGALRVINEDRVAPGKGFAPHGHADMEIISYVLSGGLAHRDSLGSGSVIRPGEVQLMSAGSGIRHSEFNASQEEPVHFLQVWIEPDRSGQPPRYQQKTFPVAGRMNQWQLLACARPADGCLQILQDARVCATVLEVGQTLRQPIDSRRRHWLQVAHGQVLLNGGETLQAGDGAACTQESDLALQALETAECLWFDLP